MNAQKEMTALLIKNGMSLEAAAMHAAVLGEQMSQLARKQPKVKALIAAAQNSNDTEFKAEVVSAATKQTSAIIQSMTI